MPSTGGCILWVVVLGRVIVQLLDVLAWYNSSSMVRAEDECKVNTGLR